MSGITGLPIIPWNRRISVHQSAQSCRLNEGVVSPGRGFSLVETMIALAVLAFGLLTAGQMLYTAASSSSLARSKGAAAILAQDRMESLASLYQQDASAGDMAIGRHGPNPVEIANPENETILNRYAITWDVSPVPDPRPGIALNSRRVQVTITPVSTGGTANSKPGMNKILNLSTVLTQAIR